MVFQVDFESFQNLALRHRSIRSFLPDPIDEKLLEKLIECGLHSSSSGNLQTWCAIVTKDKEKKADLYKAHLDQKMVLEAPVVLTFCSDNYRTRKWIEQRGSKLSFNDFFSFLIGLIDAIIAAQSTVLAAESAGLGVCYMGTTLASAKKISDILDLPKWVFPATSFVLGFPAETPSTRDRLPLRAVLHREKYQKFTSEVIDELHQRREKDAWERYRSIPEISKKIDELGIKNVTDFYTSEIKYSKEWFVEISRALLDLLEEKDLFLSPS